MKIEFKAGAGVPHSLKKLKTIRTKIITQATNAALNKAAVAVKTEAARAISKTAGLPVGRAKKLIEVKRSSFKTLSAVVIPSKKPINLIEYVAKRKAVPGAFRLKRGRLNRGGGVVAKAWGEKKTYKGTFIISQSGKARVVRRKGAARLPLKPVYGPSIKSEFLEKQLRKAMAAKASSTYLKNYEHELNHRLGKLKNG